MSLTVFSSYEESYFFHLIRSTRVNPMLSWRADFVYFPSLQVTGEFTHPDFTEVWMPSHHLTADMLRDHSIGCPWNSRMDRQQRAQGVSLCSTAFSDSGRKAACKIQSTGTGKINVVRESNENSIKPFCSEMPEACATAGSSLQDTQQILSFHTACFPHHKCSSARVTGSQNLPSTV